MKKKKILKLYREMLDDVLASNYGKRVIFYQGEGEWYNRDTCEYMSDAEVCEYARGRLIREKVEKRFNEFVQCKKVRYHT